MEINKNLFKIQLRYEILNGYYMDTQGDVIARAATFWHVKSSLLPPVGDNDVGDESLDLNGIPAMLYTVHAAHLVMFILECSSSLASKGQVPASKTESVRASLPDTMFPMIRKVGVMTEISVWSSKATRRGTTPASTTSWIHSLGTNELRESEAKHRQKSLSLWAKEEAAELLEHWMRKVVMAQVRAKLHQNHLTIAPKKKNIRNCSHDSIKEIKFTKVSHLIKVSIGIIKLAQLRDLVALTRHRQYYRRPNQFIHPQLDEVNERKKWIQPQLQHSQ